MVNPGSGSADVAALSNGKVLHVFGIIIGLKCGVMSSDDSVVVLELLVVVACS